MPNSYVKMYVHAVFGVKHRRALLSKDWRQRMFHNMGKIINDEGCRVILVNGVEDHVHCLFLLKPDIKLSRVLQRVKSLSSGWINQNNLTTQKFSWQSGYGAFSHSESSVQNVIRYIERQEEHHAKRSFQEEYIEFLERFDIDYEDQYIFQDLE